MIIRFATGLYSTVLPQKPSDSGSVTFTISNEPPPRTNLLFPKVPQAIVEKRRRPINTNVIERRLSVGELAFTVNTADRSQIGSNQSVFEIGQILEFDNDSTLATNPMLVSPKTTIQHDLARINYEGLGVTPAQVAELSAKALESFNNLMGELNLVVEQRKNAEAQIIDLQKVINDSDRTINALQVIDTEQTGTDGFVDGLLQQVKTSKAVAVTDREVAIKQANDLAALAVDLQTELRQVGTVVK